MKGGEPRQPCTLELGGILAVQFSYAPRRRSATGPTPLRPEARHDGFLPILTRLAFVAVALAAVATGCRRSEQSQNDRSGDPQGADATAEPAFEPSVVVTGVLRSSDSALGRLCRPPVCAVENLDPGFDVLIELQPWRDARGETHTDRWEGAAYFPTLAATERAQAHYPSPGSVVEIRLADPRPTPGGAPSHHRFAIRRVDDARLARAAVTGAPSPDASVVRPTPE